MSKYVTERIDNGDIKQTKKNIIAVDFDGTLCTNKYPDIGEPNKNLIAYLKKRQSNGDKLILWTRKIFLRILRMVLLTLWVCCMPLILMDVGLRLTVISKML